MQRPSKGLRLDTTSPGTRSLERSAEFLVEIFLKTRDDHIEAQYFPGKAVLGAEYLRPCNPPLPFVLRLGATRDGAIRHGVIISPPSPGAQCPAARPESSRVVFKICSSRRVGAWRLR